VATGSSEWIAGMSHQDKDDLRTPVAELNELSAPICEVHVDAIARHVNATFDLTGVMVTALLTFGRNHSGRLSARAGRCG